MRRLLSNSFPENERALATSIEEQIAKAEEELAEVKDAFYSKEKSETDLAEEIIDTMIALDGILPKLREKCVGAAFCRILKKGRERGDYDKPGTKVCAECGRELPLSDFARHSNARDGYHSKCRDCLSRLRRSYYGKL